jgi:Protein of unknown function (DUF2393)
MGGLISQSPVAEQEPSAMRPILIGVVIVAVVIGFLALLLRSDRQPIAEPHPYSSNLKISDLKMSAAQNFVGATVSYIDGNVTNAGDKTVIHATVQVTFSDDMGQTAQRENIPVRVLQTSGPYPDTVDFNLSPLAPGQTKPFRLTFESLSTQWNHQYPDIRVTDVVVR